MRLFLSVLLGVLFVCVCSCKEQVELNSKLVPRPAFMEIQEGDFLLNAETKICVVGRSIEALSSGKHPFLLELKSLFGKTPAVISSENACEQQGMICVELLELKEKDDEGYELSVNTGCVMLSATSEAGIFYGLQSLLQLAKQNKISGKSGLEMRIPAVHIQDAPRFEYRGMHLDVGRHFTTKENMLKFIDYMALYKLNSLQWHLTEDQGWRIEIKKYPLLTEVGAWRKETVVGNIRGQKKPYQYDNTPYGGFYTQEDVKEIVAYAKARHITIIPEIDLPGHTTAVLAAYPHLACSGSSFEVATSWGVKKDVVCPTEEAVAFFKDVLAEVITLFDSKYIHLGGDECPKDRWKESAACQRLIKKHKLKDEHELQNFFMNQLEDFLHEHGRTMIGWDEVVTGGGANSSTVIMCWRSWIKGVFKQAFTNGKVIMSPVSNCYFDYYQSKNSGEPLAWGAFLPLDKVYALKAIPDDIPAKYHDNLLGVQANVWSEYMPAFSNVEYAVLPRMAAIAEVAWSPEQDLNYNDFRERMAPQYDEYMSRGANFRVPDIYCTKDHVDYRQLCPLEASLDTLAVEVPYHFMELYYTLDGSQANSTSLSYTSGLALPLNDRVKFALYLREPEGLKFVRQYEIVKKK